MAEPIDPDELIDAMGVAEVLGLASRNVIGVYRSRYSDFPAPTVERGRCRLWHRPDIERWAKTTGRAR